MLERMDNHVFLIGPGGVGKTTAGRSVASALRWKFIDLDEEFTATVGDISGYIKVHGYEGYLAQNAAVCRNLTQANEPERYVMVLSSGFLATDILPHIVESNRRHILSNGRAILLLPSLDEREAENIVVARQMLRGFNLNEQKERAKFRDRFTEYQTIPSEWIVSCAPPSEVARMIAELILQRSNLKGRRKR